MASVVYSRIDKFGRILIPASWRKKMSKNVVLFRHNEEIVVKGEKNYLLEIEGKVKFTDSELENIDILKANIENRKIFNK